MHEGQLTCPYVFNSLMT